MTDATLETVFDQLFAHRMHLEGMVLKPNMVISGKKARSSAKPRAGRRGHGACLKRHVPSRGSRHRVPVGRPERGEATLHLSLMNKLGKLPWELTFSYGRALQAEHLKAWRRQAGNVAAGQKAFLKRAKLNGLARDGKLRSGAWNAAA